MTKSIVEGVIIVLPAISFFDSKIVYNHTHFLGLLFVLIVFFYFYYVEPYQNKVLDRIRRLMAIFSCSWLILLLIG